MKQYQVGCAIVRIHGEPDQDKLKGASEIFMKKVERKRRNEKKSESA